MKIGSSILFLFLMGCSTAPRCGDPIEARTIYVQKKSCEVRIRQVTIGSDLKIPESLKRSDLAGMELQWAEPGLVNGQVVMGHFVLVPQGRSERW